MTVQINDRVFHRKIEFQILESRGEGLFEPSMHGYDIKPLMFRCTACVRGYHVRYAIEQDRLVLSKVWIGMLHSYDGLSEPVGFTGVLFMAADRIEDVFLRSFCPISCYYWKVRQVRFDEGRVIEDEDRSREVEDLRAQFSQDPELLMEALRRQFGSPGSSLQK